jgi:sugar lactone lactonase YvrE/DNA-directed RNA polymerase subunit RPC12/RpoP
MPAPLRCPTCSAPLDVPPEFATTTQCRYCGAAVLLTERGGRVEAASAQQHYSDAIADVLRQLRTGSKIGAIKAYREHFGVGLAEAKDAVERLEAGQPGADHALFPRTARPGQARAVLAAAVLLVAVAGAGVITMGSGREQAPAPAPGAPPAATAPASPVEAPAAPPEFASAVLRFGGEGNGAGRFEDARSVAVDGAGRIYVAEYSGGRVQVFDSAGTFLTQWIADPRMPLLDLAADRGGTVYVVQSGRIRRVEGSTGRALGPLPAARTMGYNDVTVALDGSLWATTQESLVHLSRDGEVIRSIDLKEAVDEDAAPERVAVAGDGHLFVLDMWSGEVYHLDPGGRFVDRFGTGGGAETGTSMTPADVAIDGRGRVYVSDMGAGVRVFDAGGRQVGTFGDGVVFGIAFNDRDEMFATRRNDHQVVKYRLNP